MKSKNPDLILQYLDKDKKENANKFASYAKLRGQVANETMRSFAFNELYPQDIVDLHKQGYIYIHDLSDSVVAYCRGHDATDILIKGLLTNTVTAIPPKHLDSFFAQLLNYLIVSQLEWAGAQAVSDLNTLASPFVKKLFEYYEQFIDDDEKILKVVRKEIKQIMQRFIYHVNFPSRGSQTAFLNVTLNIKCPEHLKNQDVFNYGCEGVYGDYEDEARLILEAFNETMYEGDGRGRPFTFPITTIAVYPSTDFSDPIWIDLMKTMAKFGTYSIFNYIGTGIKPNSVFSLCCHIAADMTQLPPAGGRWAFDGGVGSIGVVTLNMAKIGMEAKTENDLFDLLKFLLDKSMESLTIKAEYIKKNKEKLMPLSVVYGLDVDRCFRTIGVLGLHEMTMNIHGKPLKEDVEFVKKVLLFIRNWTKEMQIKFKVPCNFEMTPGEWAATWLAQRDYETYGDKAYIQGKYPACFYTTMITPPSDVLPLGEKINIEQELIPLFTGGTIFRIYIGEANPSPHALLKLVERIAKHSKLSYFDFNPTFSFCMEDNTEIRGVVHQCPKCGAPTDTYDRIVGYYRSNSQVNVGKAQEILERHRINL